MYYLLGALALFFGEEQIKKRVESRYALNQEKPVLKNWIILTKHHNYGFSHNRQSGNRKRVMGVTAAGIFLVISQAFSAFFSGVNHAVKAGMMLLLAGGLSNACDRFKRSYVVDYFIINKGRLKKTIFNLADMMLLLGAVVCAIGCLFLGSSGEK